jgi:hypothetical protein
MRIGAILLAMLLAQPANAFCLLGCDVEVSEPVAAKAAFEAQLGQTLPDGVTVERIRQGGFQDKFIQVLITTDYKGAQALAAMLKVPAAFDTPINTAQLGPTGPDWWQPEAAFTGLTGGPGKIQGYAETMVGFDILPSTADFVAIYIFAFQT